MMWTPAIYIFIHNSINLACLVCSVLSAVRNPAVQEKWGWSSATHRWYYPLKAMGVFSKKNTNALSAARMLQTCLNNAEVQ